LAPWWSIFDAPRRRPTAALIWGTGYAGPVEVVMMVVPP
jgi:hypothetical protein